MSSDLRINVAPYKLLFSRLVVIHEDAGQFPQQITTIRKLP